MAFSDKDIYESPIFPVIEAIKLSGEFIQWMLTRVEIDKTSYEIPSPGSDNTHKSQWLNAQRLSARELIRSASHVRLAAQRRHIMEGALLSLAKNYRQSIFYQLDLGRLAVEFKRAGLSLPEPLEPGAGVMTNIHDLMFRSAYYRVRSKTTTISLEEQAFARLREGMLDEVRGQKLHPKLNVQHDQILWGRSPLRLDLAGGWTDTPPYCILYGGRVVNLSVELNGQPPIQVYIRPTTAPFIMIHSIDLGVSEVIRSYSDIAVVSKVGSAFSIPKAGLMLAGFHPDFSTQQFKTLQHQLKEFGGGLDISLMVAVPKGSGLGTSSILASAILGGLSEFCCLGWDRHEVAYRTLLLEQLLTTGGGWQDQLGGIFEGVKLLESQPGLIQKPLIRWAPDHLFNKVESASLILLYYTGITRVAKRILKDIVRGMFLNSATHLDILSDMRHHARYTYDTIRNHDWEGLTAAIRYSWELNQRLDAGTNPPEIASILFTIKDYVASCKLLGAGGGGYLLIFAKDVHAASQIRSLLLAHPPNPRARFVNWKLSLTGLEITKS
jgi:galactokinase/mevalonate kinase-like predicted kinase